MTATTAPPDPLDIVPDPTEVRRRLGMTYRAARILRGLLRLSERRRDHDRLSVSSETARPAPKLEGSHDA